jgi:spermidine/putrescine transport system substrate-binding protein
MTRLLLIIFSLAGLAACTGNKNTSGAKRVVNLAIWNNYLSPELQKKFTEKTGIELKISNYSSNEELLAKVQSGASGIDVAVPSDYMVGIMVKTSLLEGLKQELITNRTGVDPLWLNLPFDPKNEFSMPYAWSTTGIAYNKKLIQSPPKSWKDFFTKAEYAGKLSMLDDVREASAAALKMNGMGINVKTKEELAKAEKVLLTAKSRIKMFRSDTMEALQNKEIAVAQAYSSDSLQASAKTQGEIEFVLPEEGGAIASDNLVILKGARNILEAHELINFMLSPEVNVAFVESIRGGPVLKDTRKNLSGDLKNSPALFPSAELLKKFERLEDVGDATALYDELWTKVKTN